jgi:phage tail tube protein FII
VEDHRLIDNGRKCEDITSFTPPSPEHPTSEVKSAGMVMDIDVPNIYHYNAMEFSVSHNNGTNCEHLCDPGVHEIEGRIARQKYVTAEGVVELELVKIRVKGIHKSTEKGEIETDNPYGSTEKYSVIRYEEEVDGVKNLIIDSTAGVQKVNGVNYGSQLSSLLD